MKDELLLWYDQTKRDLPWRRTRDPYAIWLSEIMLQQTRTETVRGYWQRFLERFPTVQALAAANEEDTLKMWEGLGYYSRARNLHACAKAVCALHGGSFPQTAAALKALPGIGDYTAGAVASIAFGERTPAVDGNVERVVARLCGIRENVGIPSVRRALRAQAEALVPADRPGDWNQAMMELGARVCLPGAPKCEACPLRAFCDAYTAGDAAALPVKTKKAPQKVERRAVGIAICRGRALVLRREEGLLRGLWTFPCPEGGAEALLAHLAENGVNARTIREAGHVRHVFTHRVWEMELYLLAADGASCPPGWRWADASELAALPMPAAMKKARELALSSEAPTFSENESGGDSL